MLMYVLLRKTGRNQSLNNCIMLCQTFYNFNKFVILFQFSFSIQREIFNIKESVILASCRFQVRRKIINISF